MKPKVAPVKFQSAPRVVVWAKGQLNKNRRALA